MLLKSVFEMNDVKLSNRICSGISIEKANDSSISTFSTGAKRSPVIANLAAFFFVLIIDTPIFVQNLNKFIIGIPA